MNINILPHNINILDFSKDSLRNKNIFSAIDKYFDIEKYLFSKQM